jgi:hypothetical protein
MSVLPFLRLGAGIVRNCTDSRLRAVAFCQSEEERTHAQTVVFRSLSYMWCRCREALRAAFWWSALRTTCGPEAISY